MKKYTLVFLGIVAAAAIIAVIVVKPNVVSNGSNQGVISDARNTTYIIDENPVTLNDGKGDTVSVFSADSAGDLNSDGMIDTLVILTQDDGGSGTFYYVAVAVKTETGYEGTNAILLGNRIAPQSNEIRNGFAVVNYAVRNDDEPMTTQPSVGVSKYLRMQGKTLVDVTIANPLIQVNNIVPGQTVTSPLLVTGIARGNWYFEASFPVEVRDMNDAILARTPAQAQADWMTTNFVPFAVTLTFTGVPGQPGTIILRKDNPSGEPQNDDSISIPIVF